MEGGSFTVQISNTETSKIVAGSAEEALKSIEERANSTFSKKARRKKAAAARPLSQSALKNKITKTSNMLAAKKLQDSLMVRSLTLKAGNNNYLFDTRTFSL
jgi:hypothetical protein